ncbi:hypothetical protein EC990713_3175, partial [Escherichia coli 99.0713]
DKGLALLDDTLTHWNTKARLRAARTAILYAENDLKNIEQKVNQ